MSLKKGYTLSLSLLKNDLINDLKISKEIVELVEECTDDPEYLEWLSVKINKENLIDKYDREKLKNIINTIIDYCNKSYVTSSFRNKTIYEMFIYAKEQENLLKNKELRVLHKFDDGHYIINLMSEELIEEGEYMSNCVGDYRNKVKSKRLAILALKNKKHKTIAHIEVLKNGAIYQNYEKANMPIRYKNWKYVTTFFKKNKKEPINLSNKELGFNFMWNLKMERQALKVFCNIPEQIRFRLTSEGELEKEYDPIDIKGFGVTPFLNEKREAFFENKKELIDYLNKYKENITNRITDMIKSIKITNGEMLFLSDEIKEKIFGESYLMKGCDYKHEEIYEGLGNSFRYVNEMVEDNGARPTLEEEELTRTEIVQGEIEDEEVEEIEDETERIGDEYIKDCEEEVYDFQNRTNINTIQDVMLENTSEE